MARRRLTVKRIDPWSVLKFGMVVNLAMLGVGMVVAGVVFFFVDRLELIDQACDIALEVGFRTCGLNVGNLFRALALLGLLGVIILTAVAVFMAFLHNLIADLTGGLTFTVIDDSPSPAAQAHAASHNSVATTSRTVQGTMTGGAVPGGHGAVPGGHGAMPGGGGAMPGGTMAGGARRADERDLFR